MTAIMTRLDGPNQSAKDKTISFNDGSYSSISSEDDVVNNVPSRVVKNINIAPSAEADTLDLWSRSIANELHDARTQLVVPVTRNTDTEKLSHAAAVNGSDYYDNGDHVVISQPNKDSIDLQSYAFKAADAISTGYDENELYEFLTSKGLDNNAVEDIITKANGIQEARSAGYDDDDIKQFLAKPKAEIANTRVDPKDAPGVDLGWAASIFGEGYVEAVRNDAKAAGVPFTVAEVQKEKFDRLSKHVEDLSPGELMAALETVSPNLSSMHSRVSAFFGNQEAKQLADQALIGSRQRIIELAKERGVNLTFNADTGSFFTEEGREVDAGIVDTLFASKFETGAMIAGGLYGNRVGAAAGPLGAVAGALVGGAIGAAIGAPVDYLAESIKIQSDLEAKAIAMKSLNAAETSAIYEALGLGAFKVGAGLFKGTRHVVRMLKDGNKEGAIQSLKDIEFLSDDQLASIVSGLESITKEGTVAKDKIGSSIVATAITKPGTETLVRAASASNRKVASSVMEGINSRANELLKTTAEASGEDLGKILREDLSGYVADVKARFSAVKEEAARSTMSSNFRFNYNKLAIEPVMETLQKNITDPTVLGRFMLQVRRVKSLSDGRTFSDLLDLRQLVNEFRYNKRITKQKDYETLNKVINGIDQAIDQGAGVVFKNPKEWLDKYASARIEYAKMKQVERNVMYKAITKPGVNAEDVTKNISRYVTALDGTFDDILGKVPVQMRQRMENSVVDTLANKYTAGSEGGLRATHFPMLAKELDAVNLTTPKARTMKAAIKTFSEVFKNDIELARISGSIDIPRFKSYLTVNPLVRAKYELASSAFNFIRTLTPTKKSGELALVKHTAKLLENPLNIKTIKEVMKELDGKVNISESLATLQKEQARKVASSKDATAVRAKVFGKGPIKSFKPITAGEEAVDTIASHRIASAEVAKRIADKWGINPTNTKAVDQALVEEGYVAVQHGSERVRVIK